MFSKNGDFMISQSLEIDICPRNDVNLFKVMYSRTSDGSECGRQVKTVLERWRESLLTCCSLSQLFLHLSTLERSVLWAKSILNARCKVCRRKGDSENMLLCDGCDRGHHIFCVRPKLKVNFFLFPQHL